jgi:4-carboxymuconolactone decarboxylase
MVELAEAVDSRVPTRALPQQRTTSTIGALMSSTDGNSKSWVDRDERLADARREYEAVMTRPGPDTSFAYYDAGVVGFVFGEMWPRPGLTRKDRRWVTLACVTAAGVIVPIQTHIYGALNSGDCTLEEMDEFGLHVATQLGWPKGQNVNRSLIEIIAQIAEERRQASRGPDVNRWADPAELADRVERGRAAYEEIMLRPAPVTATTFRQAGYLAYLYGEVWTRPGLSRKARRIVSICCAAHAGAAAELQSHLYAALASGDLTYEELQELVLHYAVYQGWLSGAALDDALVAVHEQLRDEGADGPMRRRP